MGVTYFKRYRMEIDLERWSIPQPKLAPGYRLLPWDANLLDFHAQAKYESFRSEIDANVFPCLGDPVGCQRLMSEIAQRAGFLPMATWLLSYEEPAMTSYVGTIQGIRDSSGLGAVQNIGITPPHRGRGLGTALIAASLDGFRASGLKRVYLEVTAKNEGAIRLYHRLGFTKLRTVYKAIDVPSAAAW